MRGAPRAFVITFVCVAVLAIGAGCGGDAERRSGATVPGTDYVPVESSPQAQCFDCYGPLFRVGALGERGLGSMTPASVINPTSVWEVRTERSRTLVQAGSVGYHPSDGLLMASRTDYTSREDPSLWFEVPDHGQITLTKAPQGRGIRASAQRNGAIEFRMKGGITGVLRLRNQTVSLDCPGPCPLVHRSQSAWRGGRSRR